MNTLLIIFALFGIAAILIGLAHFVFCAEEASAPTDTPSSDDGPEGEPCCGGDLGPCTCGRSEIPDDVTPPTAG